MGPQLYLVERETLVPPESERRALRIDVANLGLERGKLQVEVFDRSGKKVGKNLPDRPPFVPPGARKAYSLRPTPGQWRVLVAGGHLLVSPGSLPDSYRTFRFHHDPLENPAILEWRFPVPYSAHLVLPKLPANQHRLKLDVIIESREGSRRQMSASVPPGQRAGGALRILLPHGETRYRFSAGEEAPTVAAVQDWDVVTPDFLWKEWKLANPTPFAIAGRLRVEPPGLIEVDPDRLDVPAGAEQSIRLLLNLGWLANEPVREEQVEISIERTDGDKRNSVNTILRLPLLPQSFEGAGVRALAPLAAVVEADENQGQWTVALPLTNPGTEPAQIFLRFENGERSEKVILPPRVERPDQNKGEAVFIIGNKLAAQLGGASLEGSLDSDQDLVWDLGLLTGHFKVTFPVKDDLLSEEGDLQWQIEQMGRSHALAKLVYRHQKKRRRIVTLRQVNVFRNEYPRDTDYRWKRFRPGEEGELAIEILRVWPWSRISLRAEVLVVCDDRNDLREASAAVWWSNEKIDHRIGSEQVPAGLSRRGFFRHLVLFSWMPMAWRKTISVMLAVITLGTAGFWLARKSVPHRGEIVTPEVQSSPTPTSGKQAGSAQSPSKGAKSTEAPTPPPETVPESTRSNEPASATEQRRVVSPEPRTPESRATGTLSVNANPWAQVWVDGKFLGETPIERELSVGSHKIVLRFQGREAARTVTIRAGEPYPLTHNW
jgi:hypothetical protein